MGRLHGMSTIRTRASARRGRQARPLNFALLDPDTWQTSMSTKFRARRMSGYDVSYVGHVLSLIHLAMEQRLKDHL
jgi:hypothetical protein